MDPDAVLHVTLEDPIGRESLGRLGADEWPSYRKTSLTRAIRVATPFRVLTSESENEPFLCHDGYLAVDARGYPYPIAADEFEQIYEPAEPVGDPTLNELGGAMQEILEQARARVGTSIAGRDYALAATHLEDALTRYNSGRYHENGTWKRADPDRA